MIERTLSSALIHGVHEDSFAISWMLRAVAFMSHFCIHSQTHGYKVIHLTRTLVRKRREMFWKTKYSSSQDDALREFSSEEPTTIRSTAKRIILLVKRWTTDSLHCNTFSWFYLWTMIKFTFTRIASTTRVNSKWDERNILAYRCWCIYQYI